MVFATLLVSFSFAAPASVDPPVKEAEPTSKKELFAKEDFYKSQEGKEQDFVGILKYTPPAEGVIGFGRTNPYRLEFTTEKGSREVYVGGKPELLKAVIGKKVKMTGKPVDMEVEGKNHKEIWPARLEVLPEEKKADPKESPARPLDDPKPNH